MVPVERGSLRILHAIHDFLPRHRAGSEIYAAELARAQAPRHHVTVVCAEYDPLRRHGDVTWRLHERTPVVEIVNNWVASHFRDSYRSPLITDRLTQVLRAVQPHVLHVHNLLNLSFDLPAAARTLGIPVVATLHDYTLVCASGGQRVHRAESHICTTIDTDRCARCFAESPFHSLLSVGPLARAAGHSSVVHRAARFVMSRFPQAARSAAIAVTSLAPASVTASDIDERLVSAAGVFRDIDLFVAPSQSLGDEYVRLGVDRAKLRVSDYGFVPLQGVRRTAAKNGRLRIGFVGTLVWHKGVHVLIDAARRLPRERFTLSIYGGTDVFPPYVAELREESNGLPIEFKGTFLHDQLADVYSQLDVLVVPSLWLENSPLVIHEAFMAGVPVVGARAGGIADLVEHEKNGLLYESHDPSALADALRRLIDDSSLLARLSRQMTPVKSIAQDAAEWDDVYAELLGCRES